jgi:predicted nucleic acid-binding Zn ribbon protein
MRQKKEFICKESGNKMLFKEKKRKKERSFVVQVSILFA